MEYAYNQAIYWKLITNYTTSCKSKTMQPAITISIIKHYQMVSSYKNSAGEAPNDEYSKWSSEYLAISLTNLLLSCYGNLGVVIH